MKTRLILFISALLISASHAGVYGDLEFGDSRETVTKKLRQSPLVEQTVDDVFTARTGLNGIYKCKARISGLTCHLYFNWDEQGGLDEITLRSEGLALGTYSKQLRQAWLDAERLFSEVYSAPVQKAPYPALDAFQNHKMMISHIWDNPGKGSILMGTGVDADRCFLFVRFASREMKLSPAP